MQTLIYIILTLLIIGVIRYFIFQSKSENNYNKLDNQSESIKTGETEKKPEQLNKPREGQKDDLLLIKGLGKVSKSILNENGIYHIDQIAKWTKEEAKWMENTIAFPGKVKREEWIEQAKILVKGEDTEYSKRVGKNRNN